MNEIMGQIIYYAHTSIPNTKNLEMNPSNIILTGLKIFSLWV